MNPDDWQAFEHKITAHIDARLRKLFGWIIGMIIGGLASIITWAISWGQLNERVINNVKGDDEHHHDHNLHMPADQKYATFVTKGEWATVMAHRDKSLDDLKTAVGETKAALFRLEDKIDKLNR